MPALYSEGIYMPTEPPRMGFGLPVFVTAPPPPKNGVAKKITDYIHPDYTANIGEWEKWRLAYGGGQPFIERYLKKFSRRERRHDFDRRKSITPAALFAKAAINDIKNSIFQRIADVTRTGGPTSYIQATQGRKGGVDGRNSTINWFIGTKVIPELLVMARVGVYVDKPPLIGPTRVGAAAIQPYLYIYTCENILNWVYDTRGNLKTVLLRDWVDEIDEVTGLPVGRQAQYRLLTINPEGFVTARSYNSKGELLSAVDLNLKEIPLHIFEISDSLMKDVANHQIALMNLESSDLGFVLLANFPMYTEQVAQNFNPPHLRRPDNPNPDDPNCDTNDLEDDDSNIEVGVVHGRRYGPNLDRPDFIAPPTAPLQASMDKQEALKKDIRLLVNLALSSIQPKMASAQSKEFDQQGLEAGLSYIGLELQHGERRLGSIWTDYEGSEEPPEIKYPERYSLQSDEDRRKEAKDLMDTRHDCPSLVYQHEVCKRVAFLLIGNRVSSAVLDTVYSEIDKATVLSLDPDVLLNDIKEGLLSRQAVAKAKGYPDGDLAQAALEAANRLARIQAAQTPSPNPALPNSLPNPAARGLPILDVNPQSGSQEKVGKPKRGSGAGAGQTGASNQPGASNQGA